MIKTILVLIVVFFLIRTVSKMFLPSAKKKRSNARFFYQTFKNVHNQQKRHKQRKQQQTNKSENHIDDIEEAEFEDVTDEDEPRNTSH